MFIRPFQINSRFAIYVILLLICSCITTTSVSAADTTAPVLHELYFSAENATAGEDFWLYANVTDEGPESSGVKSVTAYINNPVGITANWDPLSYNAVTDLWEKKVNETQYWLEGDYYVSGLTWVDYSFNSGFENDGMGWVGPRIYINATTPDSTPPHIVKFFFDRDIVTTYDWFTIYANVTDDLSGVRFVDFKLYGPENTWIDQGTMSYNTTLELWESISMHVGESWSSGSYYIYNSATSDNVFNHKDQFNGTDFPSDILTAIIDETPPELFSIGLSQDLILPGTSVTVYANLTDDMTGVASAEIDIRTLSNDTFGVFSLGYNPSTTLWEVVVPFPDTGVFVLIWIYVTDVKENIALYKGSSDFSYTSITVFDASQDGDGDTMPDFWESYYGFDPGDPTDATWDNDTDGLLTYEEYMYGTHPGYPDDTDGDSLWDGVEIHQTHTDPSATDSDGDGVPDPDEDYDGDGLTNHQEANLIPDLEPDNYDTDGDCLDDGYEYNLAQLLGHPHTGYSYWLVDDIFVDYDGDGLNWLAEYNAGTDIHVVDTDGDGLDDFEEVIQYRTNGTNPDTDYDTLSDYDEIIIYGTNPHKSDTDDDMLSDWFELNINHWYTALNGTGHMINDTGYTNAKIADTDGDGLLDGEELIFNGTNPLMPDSDFDGIGDFEEVYIYHSSPELEDTDGDGLGDYYEIIISLTNVNASDSDGDGLDDFYEHYSSLTDPWVEDTDGDLLTDFEENNLGTNPLLADEDGDTLIDSIEVAYGSDCNDTDSDDDLLPDFWEYEYGLDSSLNETYLDLDFDGLNSLMELYNGTHPADADPDQDNLNDYYELMNGTDPWDPDCDGDGVLDGDEFDYGSHPLYSDSDLDGLDDYQEIFVYGSDPALHDTDSDFLNDCDEILVYFTDFDNNDTDADGISDGFEVVLYFTDPTRNDTDADGLSDYFELFTYFTDPSIADGDFDDLLDGAEFAAGTDPFSADTDLDDLLDGAEVYIYYTEPLLNDTDSDTLGDGMEVLVLLSNPLEADTDSDEMPDGWEAQFGLKITEKDDTEDPDDDGLTNIHEYNLGTDPMNPDSDGDQVDDGTEVEDGTDPLDPGDHQDIANQLVDPILEQPLMGVGAIIAFCIAIFTGLRSYTGGKGGL